MTWTTDRLPIVLPPLPGEALDSWIEAYARRLRTSSTGLLRFLGLPGIAAKHLVFRLEEADLKALARLTDADASELDRMTLRSVARSDLLPQLPQNGDETAPVWRHLGRHSRFCPRCLADNGAAGHWPGGCRSHSPANSTSAYWSTTVLAAGTGHSCSPINSSATAPAAPTACA
jgi:TniQ